MWAWAVHSRYVRFSQKSVGVLGWEETLPWARRRDKLHSTIRTVLLSGLFPGTRGCNIWTLACEPTEVETLGCLFHWRTPGDYNSAGHCWVNILCPIISATPEGIYCLVSESSLTVTPWTMSRQTPLSMGFPRQEYWSGLPFPSVGDLLTQGLNAHLLHCRQILYHWATWEALLGG